MAFYIRTEASRSTGLGHLFRTVTLARKIKEAFKVKPLFLLSGEDIASKIIKENKFPLEVFEPCSASAVEERETILSHIKSGFLSVVIIDMPGLKSYKGLELKNRGFLITIPNEKGMPLGDMIIDISGHYNKSKEKLVLSGYSYQILREEFLFYRKRYRPHRILRNVLITFGGSDPYGVTPKVANMLPSFSGEFSFTLILGPAFKHRLNIKAKNIKIISSPQDMPRLMTEFDLAIAGFGITCYELACLGVPTLIVGQVEKEIPSIRRFCQKSGAIDLGMHTNLTQGMLNNAIERVRDFSARKMMWQRERSTIDGRGVHRVIRAISSLIKE